MTDPQALSEREMAVLRLVAEGATNQQIAHQLAISTNTVKVHLRNVYSKLGVESRTEATVEAVRRGLIVLQGAQLPVDVARAPGVELQTAGAGLETELAPASPPPSIPAAAQLADEAAEPAGVALELPTVVVPAPEQREEPRPARREPLVRIRSSRVKLALALAALILLGGAGWVLAGLLDSDPVTNAGSPTPGASSTPRPDATAPPGSFQPTVAVSRTWSSGPALPDPRSGHAAVAISGEIYVIGGEGPSGVAGTTWRYNPEQSLWTPLQAKPLPVADVMGAVLNRRIFVPGGRTAAGAPSAIVEVYDPDSDRWERAKPLPQPRSGYGLVAFEGRLYLFGGMGENGPATTVFVYDPTSDQWSSATPLEQPLAYPAVAASPQEGRIFIMGGEGPGGGPQTAVLRFTPGSSQPWSSLAPLPSACPRPAAAVVGRTLYLLGGGASDPVLRYDLRADRWLPFDLKHERDISQAALVELEGSIYALGGASDGAPLADNRSFSGASVVLLPEVSSGESP